MEGGFTNDKLLTTLALKKKAWQDAISSAENKITSIEAITKRLSTSEPATKLHELSDEERAWLPVKMVSVEDLRGQSVLSEAIWL